MSNYVFEKIKWKKERNDKVNKKGGQTDLMNN